MTVTIFFIGLPDAAPRYVVLNYKGEGDAFGKVIFINWIPTGCQTAASMLHVGTLPVIERLVCKLAIVSPLLIASSPRLVTLKYILNVS